LFQNKTIVDEKTVEFTSNDTQALLPGIVDQLASQNFNLGDVSEVIIVPGINRFTVDRLTTVIANGIGWTGDVPVTVRSIPLDSSTIGDKKAGTTFEPVPVQYSKSPTIN